MGSGRVVTQNHIGQDLPCQLVFAGSIPCGYSVSSRSLSPDQRRIDGWVRSDLTTWVAPSAVSWVQNSSVIG